MAHILNLAVYLFVNCQLNIFTQEMEANLDIIMDRMRQDAAEATLKDSLKKALLMLDKIKDGYDHYKM